MENTLLILGTVLASGFIVGRITHVLGITSVIGYILAGIVMGPDVMGLVDPSGASIELITVFTLSLVIFVIGTRLTLDFMREMGRDTITIFLFEAGATFLLAFLAVYYFLGDLPTALILGSLAPATAPVSMLAVIQELRADGPLTRMALATLGFDNVLTIVLFVLSVGVINGLIGGSGASVAASTDLLVGEIGASVVIGAVTGGLLSVALDEFRDRDFRFVMVLAAVMVSAGAAEYFHGSPILASMVTGVVFANLLPELEDRTRGLIEEILEPLFVLFFVLVGISAHLGALAGIGALGLIYVGARVSGKVGGSFLGATVSGAPRNVRNYFGISLMPQAGLAVGLALLVGNEIPGYTVNGLEIGQLVVTLVAATSIFFEVVGPVLVRFALTRSGEARTP